MKAEIYNVANKGVCIIISDISPDQLRRVYGIKAAYPYLELNSNMSKDFNDIAAIADQIRMSRKIGAIKEVRSQTGWGLKESKDYVDKYIPMGTHDDIDYREAADKFLSDHALPDFIDSAEMQV